MERNVEDIMNQLEQDRAMMRRALELARRGAGRTSPNPMVGAVITDAKGQVIGEGWHREVGGPHAEVEAFASVEQGADLSEATLYVTLEPCAHAGRTPPCTDAVISSGIRRVVVAMRDPYPLVNGRGNKRLREAGIEVVVGVLEAEAARLNETWLHFVRTGRPFVTVKVAQSLDGYIALPEGESKWITGELARQEVHRLRAGADAILVGTRTALQDDPSLTVRHGVIGRTPLRVVLDRRLELPTTLKVFSDDEPERTILMIGEDFADDPKVDELRMMGITVEALPVEGNRDNLQLDQVVDRLGARKITSLLVEGGAAVIDTMIADNLVNKLIIFLGPKLLGHGIKSFRKLAVPTLADARLVNIRRAEMIGEDVIVEGYLQ